MPFVTFTKWKAIRHQVSATQLHTETTAIPVGKDKSMFNVQADIIFVGYGGIKIIKLVHNI